MGNILFNSRSENTRTESIWPVRSFFHANNKEEIIRGRYGLWDPDRYRETLKYPAQEPAKDL